jgi:hypothetical protein
MNIQQAKKEGAKAYLNGKKSAPALNQEFLIAACKSELDTAELLAAYIYGWDIANLATNAPIPTMPSIRIFNDIMMSE